MTSKPLQFLGLVLLVATSGGCSENSNPKPSILLVTLGSTRFDHLGLGGRSPSLTPRLDILANRAAVFDQAMAPTPMTRPNLVTLLSGLSTNRHQVFTNQDSLKNAKAKTLAEVLGDGGYSTAAFVSSPLLGTDLGLEPGFESYATNPQGEGSEWPIHKMMPAVQRWLQERISQDQAYFCWVHLAAPSPPFTPPEPFRTRHLDEPYAGEIAYADNEIGRLFQQLEGASTLAQTHVIVISDHGLSLGENGEHGSGVFVHDATTRIPLIWRGPEIEPGRRSHQMFTIADLGPTLLELCHQQVPQDWDGQSRVPWLERMEQGKEEEQPDWNRAVMIESRLGQRQYGWHSLFALRSSRFKLIAAQDASQPWNPSQVTLYDLTKDPFEQRDVGGEHPSWVNEGLHRLKQDFEASPIDGGAPSTMDLDTKRALLERLTRLKDYEAKERISEMIAESRLILKVAPKNASALKSLGIALVKASRFQEAAEPLEKARGLGMDSYASRVAMGLIRMAEENWQEAMDEFQAAVEEDPLNPVAYRHLGFVNEVEGRDAEALKNYRQFIELASEGDEWRSRIREKLRELEEGEE